MQWWEGWRRRRRRRRPCPRRAFASCRGGRSADCAWLSTVLSDPGRLSGSRRFGARRSRDVLESRLHRHERCSSVSHQARRWEEDEAGAEHRDGQESGDRGGWGHGAAWSRRHMLLCGCSRAAPTRRKLRDKRGLNSAQYGVGSGCASVESDEGAQDGMFLSLCPAPTGRAKVSAEWWSPSRRSLFHSRIMPPPSEMDMDCVGDV